MKIFNYENLKRLKRGIRLYVFLSFKCNFDCAYCVAKIPNKQYPAYEGERTFEEWKEFISTFPVKVKELRITGGEPFENDVTVPLANWAVSEGYFVIIETNLSVNMYKIWQLTNTKKVQLYVTYHRGQIDKDEWLLNYNFIKRILPKCTIIANSFAKKEFSSAVVKDWVEPDTMRVPKFIIGPDLQIFRNCFEAYGAYNER